MASGFGLSLINSMLSSIFFTVMMGSNGPKISSVIRRDSSGGLTKMVGSTFLQITKREYFINFGVKDKKNFR